MQTSPFCVAIVVTLAQAVLWLPSLHFESVSRKWRWNCLPLAEGCVATIGRSSKSWATHSHTVKRGRTHGHLVTATSALAAAVLLHAFHRKASPLNLWWSVLDSPSSDLSSCKGAPGSSVMELKRTEGVRTLGLRRQRQVVFRSVSWLVFHPCEA